MAINRSREGLRCEPMGRYSKKSTLRGSVYLLIEVQEGAEAVFDETGGRNFEKIDRPADPKKVATQKSQFFRKWRLTVHGRVLGASPWADIRKSLHTKGLSTSS